MSKNGHGNTGDLFAKDYVSADSWVRENARDLQMGGFPNSENVWTHLTSLTASEDMVVATKAYVVFILR